MNSNSHSGFSLIEVMIAAGVMSIVALGIASMMSDMSAAQVALEEKLAALEAASGLQRAFAEPTICGYQLSQAATTATVDLSPPNVARATLSYLELRMGTSSTSPLLVKRGESLPGYNAGKMKVQSIILKNISSNGGDSFSGDLEVVIDPTTMRRSIKPFGVKRLVFTATPFPYTAATVSGCGSDATPAGTPCGIQWSHNGNWLTPNYECRGNVTLPGARMRCPPGYGGGTPITDSVQIIGNGPDVQWTCAKL